MAKIFSITEHRLIRSLLAAKTDDQLADMVGCSKEEMTSYISKLTGVPKRIEAKAPKPSKAAQEISLKKLQRRAQKVRRKKR
jgi:ParB-like chromosome segregation protein Spo0J